jgi:acetyl esterase/lipase
VSFDGTQIVLTNLSPAGADLSAGDAPCVYWVHGGGMIMGDRHSQIDIPLDWLASFGAVVVSVDYRLAPDSSGMTLVEHCYAGLV